MFPPTPARLGARELHKEAPPRGALVSPSQGGVTPLAVLVPYWFPYMVFCLIGYFLF